MSSLDLDDAESLRRAYVAEGRSLSAIAEMAECSYASVRRALLAHGIETVSYTHLTLPTTPYV